LPTVNTSRSDDDPLSSAWPTRTVDVTSTTSVVVRRDAEGDPALPAAVMVHGLGGSSLNWIPLATELRGQVRAELVDLPGFGRSAPPHDGDYSLSAHCRAVEAVILSLRTGPVHLFGNSMGGAVATRVAARRPDLVRTLTLVSPALPDLRVRRTALPTALMSVPGVPALATRMAKDMTVERRTRMSVELCYGDPDAVPEAVFADAVEEYRRRLGLPYMLDAFARSTRAVVASYLERGPHALWCQVARVGAPTLLVYGRRDKLVDPRVAARAYATFPDPRLLMVTGSGHVAMMEHPQLVARAFRDLLRELEPAGAQAARVMSVSSTVTG
jgi:pimeloyl-ACP methyl ester carboxylesterase